MREKGKWGREDLSTRCLWGCKLRVREEHLGEKIATTYRRVDGGTMERVNVRMSLCMKNPPSPLIAP